VTERAPLPEVRSAPAPGPVLLLAPHADDDVIGAGGTCCLHAEQGDAVHVVVVYSGVAGDPEGRHDPEELAARRQQEARAGGAHLGLTDYEFWGYPEGHEPGPADLEAAAERIAATIRAVAPATIYCPWAGEHHLDHHVLARATLRALELADFDGAAYGYEVWTPLVPTLIVDITGVRDRKVAALREHTSQLEYTDHVHKALGMQAQRSLYLPAGSRYGEAFAPLG
jgi:LmbE family N-acetylglucosaminyl deacetylase